MSRPMYETQSDLDSELTVMEKLVKRMPREHYFRKLPLAYQLDYGLYLTEDNSLQALTEVKTRSIDFGAYPTMILSAHKMHEMIAWRSRGFPTILIYNLNDGVYTYRPSAESVYDCEIKSGGRADRGDWQDIEPVYHIPVDKLHRVE